MKTKNIKKYYASKIDSGWREYLTLKFPYRLLGLNPDDFMIMKDIEELLNLSVDKDESGLVDHYNMLDHNRMFNGHPLNVQVSFKWSTVNPNKVYGVNVLYVKNDDKYYYIGGYEGYKNPEYSVNNDEPYWLYEGDKVHGFSSRIYTIDDNSSNVMKLLNKFVNNNRFSSDLFSGNFVYSLISGNFGDNISNDLFKDLSNLSTFCKTTYETFNKDSIQITFAIRYEDYVEPFLSELKKICKKHKLPKL